MPRSNSTELEVPPCRGSYPAGDPRVRSTPNLAQLHSLTVVCYVVDMFFTVTEKTTTFSIKLRENCAFKQ